MSVFHDPQANDIVLIVTKKVEKAVPRKWLLALAVAPGKIMQLPTVMRTGKVNKLAAGIDELERVGLAAPQRTVRYLS